MEKVCTKCSFLCPLNNLQARSNQNFVRDVTPTDSTKSIINFLKAPDSGRRKPPIHCAIIPLR